MPVAVIPQSEIIADYNNKRIKELAQGKTCTELEQQLAHIEGRENVRNVVLDMCDPFKNFAIKFFPIRNQPHQGAIPPSMA